MKQQGSAGGSLPEASRSVQASSGISCNVGGPLVVQQCNMDSVSKRKVSNYPKFSRLIRLLVGRGEAARASATGKWAGFIRRYLKGSDVRCLAYFGLRWTRRRPSWKPGDVARLSSEPDQTLAPPTEPIPSHLSASQG